MRRLGQYGDPCVNPYSLDTKLLPELRDTKYTAKSEHFQTQEEHIGHPPSNNIRWQMSQNSYQMSNAAPSHLLHEDQVNNGRRSYHKVYALNPSTTTNKHGCQEAVRHEEEMDIGYMDTPSALTFDGLERKFNDEILKLVKEQSDLEDAEITRHKERLIEINTQYQQQLQSIRTRQASQRREFLQKESDTRRYQYQRPGIQEYPNSGVSASIAAGGVSYQYNLHESSADATRPYGYIACEAARGYNDPCNRVPPSYS